MRDAILIVANPVSGRGRRRREHPAETAFRTLRAAGCEVELRYTSDSNDASRVVRTVMTEPARRFGCIVACGGDGTVQQVAHAIVSSPGGRGEDAPVMGLVPAGRCNDLAAALSLRVTAEEACRVILEGRKIHIDLGLADGRHFCTVATMGFDAAVSRFVDRMRMPLTGTPAYLYGALRVLMTYRSPEVELEGDFGKRRGRLFMVSTANTATYGGRIPIAPGASAMDGVLDVCVLHDARKFDVARTLTRVVTGRHAGRRGVELLRTTNLSIQSEPAAEVWADGERLTRTPSRISVVRSALQIFLPIENR